MQEENNLTGDVILNSVELLEERFSLSEDQQKELNELYDDVASKFQIGKVITGKVVSKDSGGVLVSIDYKSNGFIDSSEFSDFEMQKFEPDVEIEVLLDRLEDEDGYVVLSYQKAKALKAWDTISDLAEADEPVRGVVLHKVKGGLSVDIGIPAFLPGSQVDVQRITDFDQFVGQEVVCKILKVNKKRGNVIISRRKYIEEQRSEDRKKALESLAEGSVIQGVVKNITSYGAFVDIGGIDGLLHITDMSWGRTAHPSEILKLGDTVTVKIISFDKEHEKISLGIKQLSKSPWEGIEDRYPVGGKIKGIVSSIADYGLFIEIEKGVEGLIHISEISWTERINNLTRHYSIGDEIEVIVVSIDKENRRMSLSVKQLNEDPWRSVAERFKVGDKIKGKISNITDFGLFVQIMDGVDGLVHISDISWTDHVAHPSDKYNKSDEVEALILSIDPENRKVSLGVKQLSKDPWIDIEKQYTVGSEIEGTVSKITGFGAFVKLETGVEGLVHISELSENEVARVEDILSIGEARKFRVIKVSPEDRKIGLSLRPQRRREESKEKEQHDVVARDRSERPRFTKRPASKPKSPVAGISVSQKDSSPKGSLQQALEEHAARMRQQDEPKNDDKSE
jgi:small subunit ribosomal protein S1